MQEYLKVLEKFKGKMTGVFIDDANIFYIQRKIGWKVDWLKFKNFLEQHAKLVIWRYYMGLPPEGNARLQNERIKRELEEMSFKVITKPLKKIYLDNQKLNFKHKCNFDVKSLLISREILII